MSVYLIIVDSDAIWLRTQNINVMPWPAQSPDLHGLMCLKSGKMQIWFILISWLLG